MPSTRGRVLDIDPMDLPSDDEYDPDYRESSADESDSEIPPSMARDRAQWVVKNQEAIEELYRAFQDTGRVLFGDAFFQLGGITPFAHVVYKYSTPGAV